MSCTSKEQEDQLPLAITGVDLTKKGEELGIKYFFNTICSFNYGVHAPVVTRGAIRSIQSNGTHTFGGFDYGTPLHEGDLFAVPDADSLIQLPWAPEYGWLASNIYYQDKPLPQCPRQVLQKQINKARQLGLVIKTGVEAEFMLLKPGTLELYEDDEYLMRFQDPVVEMRRAGFISKILDSMETMGWGPTTAEKEVSGGQYEINFNYADAMTSCERLVFLKFMIKTLAEKEDMRATFMPFVPQKGDLVLGNGLHIHHSLWSTKDGANVTGDKDGELGLSQIGRHFLGGLMKHLPAVTAFGCPHINSYKRLHVLPDFINLQSYGRENKQAAVRIAKEHGLCNRFELRIADCSTNPYLLHAAIIAAGLDGIENSIEPDPVHKLEIDFLKEKKPEGMETLPKSLADALEVLDKDKVLQDRLGQEVCGAYIGVKKHQLEKFAKEVTCFEKRMVDVY